MLSFSSAVALICILLVTSLLVVLHFDRTSTFNRLTLWPYRLVIGYAAFKLLEYTLMVTTGPSPLLQMASINTVNCLVTGVAIQIFEWFNTWLAIQFQDDYDITTVVVERRLFQAREKIYTCVLRVMVYSYFLSTNGAILWSLAIHRQEIKTSST